MYITGMRKGYGNDGFEEIRAVNRPDFLSAEQVLGVEAQVIFHEGGDGEVAVIVPRLNAQRQRPVALARQLRQPRRLQLVGQELVVVALVDKDRHFSAPLASRWQLSYCSHWLSSLPR